MATSYGTRTSPTTTYGLTRLGGAYLTDVSGNYITTSLGERIIVLVPGGNLGNMNYTKRGTISTSYGLRPTI